MEREAQSAGMPRTPSASRRAHRPSNWRSLWSARGLLPLLYAPARPKAPASWTHSIRFAISAARAWLAKRLECGASRALERGASERRSVEREGIAALAALHAPRSHAPHAPRSHGSSAGPLKTHLAEQVSATTTSVRRGSFGLSRRQIQAAMRSLVGFWRPGISFR